ncbi:hypothetical protein CDAR_478061 [Caerostris darwini]|uniref:Uncharacterized protein n=1 Tax=Caerostris darwini TaxID=1538125 RepID=A0AAV4Q480_9ARAC|nr:hypothetical protein CDAR_478061 [Caerostris darwini]
MRTELKEKLKQLWNTSRTGLNPAIKASGAVLIRGMNAFMEKAHWKSAPGEICFALPMNGNTCNYGVRMFVNTELENGGISDG